MSRIFTGLKRENQMQLQGIGFVQYEREMGVVNARDHMVGKIVYVQDTIPRAFMPAELRRDTSRSILDGEFRKEHNLHKWCPWPVQCLPYWFFVFRKWLPGFSVVATQQLGERYSLSSLRRDVRATCIMKLAHRVHGYHKPRCSIQFLLGFCRMCAVRGRNSPATHMVHLPLLSQPKGELKELESDYQYPISPLTTNISGYSHDAENQQVEVCSESNVQRQHGDECRLSNADSKQDDSFTINDSLLIPIFVRHISGELAVRVNLSQSSQHLMDLYAQKTKTKLECHYFVYGRKRVEPDRTLLFYRVERDTTVHVCTRMLGGV